MFSKKLLRGIQIVNAVEGLVPIEFKRQDVLSHSIQSNTKYSPQFHDWSCILQIQFDKNNISIEDIASLINYAGFYYGIGIWSPRCKSLTKVLKLAPICVHFRTTILLCVSVT